MRIDSNVFEAEGIYSALEKLGIDWGSQLELDGVDSFKKGFDSFLYSLQEKAKSLKLVSLHPMDSFITWIEDQLPLLCRFLMESNFSWANASGKREDTSSHYNIFVGDLSSVVTNDMLLACFSVYPSCSGARVMWDQKTGRSRGFGFVSFRNQQHKKIRMLAGRLESMLGGRIEVPDERPSMKNWLDCISACQSFVLCSLCFVLC